MLGETFHLLASTRALLATSAPSTLVSMYLRTPRLDTLITAPSPIGPFWLLAKITSSSYVENQWKCCTCLMTSRPTTTTTAATIRFRPRRLIAMMMLSRSCLETLSIATMCITSLAPVFQSSVPPTMFRKSPG